MICIPVLLKEELKLINCTKISVKFSLVQKRSEQDHSMPLRSVGTQLRDQHKNGYYDGEEQENICMDSKIGPLPLLSTS